MFRKKKVLVRILDTPLKMIIEPTFILTPLPDGRVMILHGNFENIPDAEAFRIVKDTTDKLVA